MRKKREQRERGKHNYTPFEFSLSQVRHLVVVNEEFIEENRRIGIQNSVNAPDGTPPPNMVSISSLNVIIGHIAPSLCKSSNADLP